MTEYFRPWKLVTLALGINTVVYAAMLERVPSYVMWINALVMLLIYVAAPLTFWVFVDRRWKMTPVALCGAWMAVSGIYFAANWHGLAPMVDEFRRMSWSQAIRSYLLLGLFWFYRGSLRDMRMEIIARVRSLFA